MKIEEYLNRTKPHKGRMRLGLFAAAMVTVLVSMDDSRAQVPDFSTCDERLWLTQGNPTDLLSVGMTTNPFTFTNEGGETFAHNAAGFHPTDFYGYAIQAGPTPNLLRLGSNGQTQNLGAIAGIPSSPGINAGEIADDGSYYVVGSAAPSTLYKIDVGTVSATTITLSRAINIFDLAWSGGRLYTKEGGATDLIAIDPVTGSVTSVGNTGLAAGTQFGAMFGTPDAVYGSDNGGNGFYKFNTTTGQSTLISSSPGSGNNDGLKCVTSSLQFEADIQITKTDGQEAYTPGQDVTYTMQVTNNGPFGAEAIEVSDPLPAGIATANWTCAGASGATCENASGTGGIDAEHLNLPANASATYTITMSVPDDFTGELSNTVSLVLPDDVVDNNLADNTATDVTQEASMSLTKEAELQDTNNNGVPDVDEKIIYTFTVTNTGAAPLSNVTVDDPGIVTSGSIATLPPGVTDSETIIGEYTLTGADIDSGSVENHATVNAQDPDGDPVSAESAPPGGQPGDATTIDLPGSAAVEIIKTSTLNDTIANGRPDAGEMIEYTFTVTNSGNLTLTDIVVSDDRADLVGSPIAGPLAAGDSDTSVTGTYKITQADIDAGSVANLASATGKDPAGNDVTAQSSAPGGVAGEPTETELLQTPESDFVKEVSHVDANGNGAVDAGERLEYTFTVENTGNVTLTNVTVSDSKAQIVGGPIASLAPDDVDSTTITGYYDVTQADVDSGGVDNVAEATASDPNGAPVKRTSRPPGGIPGDNTTQPVVAQGSMDVVKEAMLNDANGNGFADANETIGYTFTVMNTGNVSLTDIAIEDDKAEISGSPIAGPLAPGESDTSATGSYTITQADIDAGSFANVATATGVDPQGEPVSAESRSADGEAGDPTTIEFQPNPSIEVHLVDQWSDSDGSGFPDSGEPVHYAFTVKNTGNVTINSITIPSLEVVPDPNVNPADVGIGVRATVPVAGGTLASLAPGSEDGTTFTASYPLTAAEIDAGGQTATAEVEGLTPNGEEVSDLSDDPHDGENVEEEGDGEPDDPTATPLPQKVSLVLEKSGAYQGVGTGFAEPGDTILYTFAVTNDGNVTVDDVVPVDAGPRFDGRRGTGSLSSFTPSSADIAAGDSATFTATYTLSQADIDPAQGIEDGVKNTATATGTGPRGQKAVAAEAEASVDLPGYAISKMSPLREVRRGGKVPYTIRVKMLGMPGSSTVNVIDMTPPGLTFVPGSAMLGDTGIAPVVAGRKLTFENVVLTGDEAVEITLDLAVTAAAKPGEYVNRAWVEDLEGNPISRVATAVVEVVIEAVFDCGDIIGKVFDDKNRNGYQDNGETGLAGVRVASVKGLLVTADAEGRFHIACADLPDQHIGTNYILKLDPRSLPSGYRLTTENPRVIRLTAGKVSKFTFGASIGRVVRLDLSDAAFQEDSTELRPEWQTRLAQMMHLLEQEPSILRLVYTEAGEGKKLALKRSKAMRKHIAREWREVGRRYRLEIESQLHTAVGDVPVEPVNDLTLYK